MTNRSRPLPYINAYKDRHGKLRYYFRRKGYPRRLLRGAFGSREWRESYEACMSSKPTAANARANPTKNFVHTLQRVPNGDVVTWAIVRAFSTARSRAPRRRLPFELSMADVRAIWSDQRGCCALTGIAFQCEPQAKYHKAPYAPSLDRIDNRKGYVLGNVRLVCVAVNFALGEWGEAVFADIAAGFLRRKRHPLPG